jgi:hypothetical protein
MVKSGVVLPPALLERLTRDADCGPLLRIYEAAVLAHSAVGADMMITACIDGVHGVTSKHYPKTCGALDLRTSHLQQTHVQAIIGAMERELGKDFDVIYETDHIHAEYDPKGE